MAGGGPLLASQSSEGNGGAARRYLQIVGITPGDGIKPLRSRTPGSGQDNRCSPPQRVNTTTSRINPNLGSGLKQSRPGNAAISAAKANRVRACKQSEGL